MENIKAIDVIEKVKSLINNNQVQEAFTLINESRSKFQNNYQLAILEAVVFIKTKKFGKAQHCLQTAAQKWPGQWPTYIHLASLYEIGNKNFLVKQALTQAAERQAPETIVLGFYERLATREKNFATARAMLEQLIAKSENPDAQMFVRLAHYQDILKNAEGSLAAIEQALAMNTEISLPSLITKNAVQLHNNSAINYLEALHEKFPQNRSLVHIICEFLRSTGNPEKIVAYYRKNPDFFDDTLSLPKGIALPQDLLETHKKNTFESIKEDMSAHRLTTAAELYIDENNLDAARNILLNSENSQHPNVQNLLTAIDNAPTDNQLQRPLISLSNTDTLDCIISESLNTQGIVLVFTGSGGQMMGAPVKLFDRYLASLNLSAIYLRDPQQLCFLNGILSLSKGLTETIDKLQQILSERAVVPIFTFGFCSGGWAAITYGLKLGAKAAICFSPPTNLSRTFMIDDSRHVMNMSRIHAQFPDPILDLNPVLRQNNGTMNVHLYYGDQSKEDVRQAMNLKAVPGVTLHPLTGYQGHSILGEIINRFGLLNIVKQHFLNEANLTLLA